MIELRDAEILIDSKWVKIEPIKLKKGDIFRIFEPDGTLYLEKSTAACDAYLNEKGIVTIELNVD